MNLKTLSFTGLFFCALGAKIYWEKSFHLHQTPHPNLSPLQASYQGSSLKKYALGFDNLVASLLWIEVLQVADHAPLKSGEVSWEYAELDAITTLDPRFNDAYKFGSILLSTFRRDKLGGAALLEKWEKRDRTYWRPVYMLGMHHFQELGNYASAAPYILRAAQMEGAPYWVSSLGVRLLSDSGSLLLAITTAIEMSKYTQGEIAVLHLTERIRSLSFNLQKQEWNEAVTAYRREKRKEPTVLSEVAGLKKTSRAIASVGGFKMEEIPPPVQDALKETFSFKYEPQSKKVVAVDPGLEKTLGKTGVYVEKTAAPRIR